MRYGFIIVFTGLCLIFSGPICTAQPATNSVGIVFHGDKVNIDVKDVPLDKILAAFKKAKGISYTGDKSILALKVTGKIENVSVKKALDTLLFHFEHAIIYNKDSQVIGLRIVAKGKGKDIQIGEDDHITFHEANDGGEKAVEQSTSQTKRHIGPPNGPTKYTLGDKASFTPKMNVPPPGGLPKHPAITNEQIKKDVLPPGGSLPPPMTK